MIFRFVSAVLFLLSSFTALAQEGHPYEGTWRGTIGSGANTKPVVMIIDYDGEKLTGMIDPGRNSYRFEDAMHQFERLQRRPDLDYYQRARVEARISELMPLVLEIRRRGNQTGNS